MTWKEFWVSGRIGCSRCVEEIVPFNSRQGYGKEKRRLAEDFCQEILAEVQDYIFNLTLPGFISKELDVLSFLKSQLKRAVHKEQFEAAAILRDRIRQLEEKRS
jgi:protein-arginine kinase activator protein McsA